jgi:hypothetical protein
VKRLVRIALLVGCLVVPMVTPLASATLARLSMDDLILQSTAIVRGTVGDSWTAFNGPVIYTHYKIQVSERFKGAAQTTVEVVVPGGSMGAVHQTPSGAPALKRGDEFVFFLWTSKAGLTWITGLTQGLFALGAGGAADGVSDPMAKRAANRELMLDPATARPVKDSEVSMRLSDLRARIASGLGRGR